MASHIRKSVFLYFIIIVVRNSNFIGFIIVSSCRWPSGRDQPVENVDDYITDLFKPIFVNASLQRLTKAATLAGAIKGGGGMDSHQVK
jgi:hypothetical protein